MLKFFWGKFFLTGERVFYTILNSASRKVSKGVFDQFLSFVFVKNVFGTLLSYYTRSAVFIEFNLIG